MDEKLIEAPCELVLLHGSFGEDAIIQETAEGYNITTILKSSELEGGQKLELTLGNRKEIPLDLEEQGLVLSGLPASSIRINGKLLAGYNLYIAPVNQAGNELTSIYFAEVSSRSIVMTSLKDATDLASLFHEIEHIDKDHTKEKRATLTSDVTEKIYSKYFDYETRTFDEAGFLKDSEAVAAAMALFYQELEANDQALVAMAEFGSDIFPNDANYSKVKQYLRAQIENQYLEIYGIKQDI